MICPLVSINEESWIDCQKDKCGWWDTDNKTCVMIGIKIELVKLNEKGGG